MLAGLEPDPRVSVSGTTIVFRKSRTGPVTPAWGDDRGTQVAVQFPHSSVAAFVFSGRWCIDAAIRFRKVLSDSRRPVPKV
jgi:hypothetical protein